MDHAKGTGSGSVETSRGTSIYGTLTSQETRSGEMLRCGGRCGRVKVTCSESV